MVGWLTGVLLAGWCRAVFGDGTLRGAGEDWLRWEGVETPPPPAGLFEAEPGVGVAIVRLMSATP